MLSPGDPGSAGCPLLSGFLCLAGPPTCGSRILQNFRPPTIPLIQASGGGAVIVGKRTWTERQGSSTEVGIRKTCNPWTSTVPGGSSGDRQRLSQPTVAGVLNRHGWIHPQAAAFACPGLQDLHGGRPASTGRLRFPGSDFQPSKTIGDRRASQ
jgi:hypothetical protein